MNILVLGSPDGFYCQEIQRAAAAVGHLCDIVPFEQLGSRLTPTQPECFFASSELSSAARHSTSTSESECNISENSADNRPLQEYDICIVRSMPPGSLERVIFRMDLLWSLEAAGVRVINSPKGMECAIDKYLTLTRCRHAGLLVPETICCESVDEALVQFRNWGDEAIVKPLFGGEGRGIVHLTDFETARRVLFALSQVGSVLYLQRFVHSDLACGDRSDLRVLVLGGEPIGAIRRHATDDFRTNCAISGRAELHELSEEEREIARRAAQACGVLFAGVDLISDANGRTYLLEVNGCPGWKAFEQVTGIAVADRLINWLESSQRLTRDTSEAGISSLPFHS